MYFAFSLNSVDVIFYSSKNTVNTCYQNFCIEYTYPLFYWIASWILYCVYFWIYEAIFMKIDWCIYWFCVFIFYIVSRIVIKWINIWRMIVHKYVNLNYDYFIYLYGQRTSQIISNIYELHIKEFLFRYPFSVLRFLKMGSPNWGRNLFFYSENIEKVQLADHTNIRSHE